MKYSSPKAILVITFQHPVLRQFFNITQLVVYLIANAGIRYDLTVSPVLQRTVA